MKLFNQRGQVLLITIFILGMVAIAMVMSSATTGVGRVVDSQSETTGEGALYASRAGIEEVLYRLGNDTNFGNGSPSTIQSTTLGEAAYIATISGNTEVRYATATGILKSSLKKISISLSASASAGNVVLSYAAQVGTGGIDMSQSSTIAGKDGADGNIYTNGTIQGYNSATIKGNAWSVDGINPNGGNITITKDAYGQVIKNCTVNGNTYSPTSPVNCTVSGVKNTQPAPTPIELPTIDLEYWQNAALAGGTINGDYTLGGSETESLGPKVITGNLTLNSSSKLTVTGSLWVQGNINLNSSSVTKLSDEFGENGTIILIDSPTDKLNYGRLSRNSSSSVEKTSQGGYILFVSTNEDADCSPPSAEFNSSGSAGAIMVNNGCVQMNSSSKLVAISAYKLVLNSSASITYDTGLSSDLYLPGPGVGGSGGNFGWTISSWKEVP